MSTLKAASKTLGIQVEDPIFLVIKSLKVQDWIKVIKNDIHKNERP